MKFQNDTWLILEAREEDISIPSFSKANFNPLLGRKLRMAEQIVPRDHVFLMLTDRSLPYLGSELDSVDSHNILIHPSDWGNAAAFAVQMLEIKKINRDAQVLFVPSGNACPSMPELKLVIKLASRALQEDRAKIFLIRALPQNDWNSMVLAPVSALLLLYMMSAPTILKPLLAGYHSEDEPAKKIIMCASKPEGDLYEDILSANPAFLRKLPISLSANPTPVRRAAHEACWSMGGGMPVASGLQ